MAKWAVQENYYSGQGVVMLAQRTTAGKPKGLRPIGNVSALKITVATSVLEHKESTTGQRGTDLRITTETKVGVSINMQNFNRKNLADVMRGDSTEVATGSVVDTPVQGYGGLVSPLNKLMLSSASVKQGATTLTAYVDDLTPYDYKINLDAGSIEVNPMTTVGPAQVGIVATAVTVGATTLITVPSVGVAVGEKVYLHGFTGADAATLNGKFFTVTAINGTTSITVNAVTTGLTITVGAGTKVVSFGAAGFALLASFTWAAQFQVDALTQGSTDYWMRFEGLNTANSNEAVVVDVFRILADPLKELSLISDTIQEFVLEGSVLADNLQATGSKYFRVQKLN